MANKEHVSLLRQGAEVWKKWRCDNSSIRPDLHRARLRRMDLSGVNLHRANLRRAYLCSTDLRGADLREADLRHGDLSSATLHGADLRLADLRNTNLRWLNPGGLELWREVGQRGIDLRGADLREADFWGADLRGADLRDTDLRTANLNGAFLYRADLRGARLFETRFLDVVLTGARGLDQCKHNGPSGIDLRTLQKSGPLPLKFLRGCGLPDRFIDYLPSLLNRTIQLYSCFISYSSQDEKFARRLYADLQDNGVRCWFAPEHLRWGSKILDTIDEAIRLRDRVLLILSQHSIASPWVEDEVTKAFAEERARGQTVLFPIRLDDTVIATDAPWARKLRDNRNIGDFRRWKRHDTYEKALKRLLRDLAVEQSALLPQ